MNQSDLIQKIIAAEHQAQALTESARNQQENMEASIDGEIRVLEQRYQDHATEYLRQLEQAEQARSDKRLQELDHRLQEKLSQVESIYQAKKDEWVDAIFERIIGKAGS